MWKGLKLSVEQPELFVVVDDNDNVLGYLPEDECHNKGVRHRTSSVVVFNSKGEILLQRRSPQKKLFPGFYTVSASGHVAKNADSETAQTYDEAAKREFIEELGVNPPPLKFIGTVKIESPEHLTITAIYTTIFDGPLNQTQMRLLKFNFSALHKSNK
jgi:isopentenyl-diphosphate delta-isomerase type 1